MFEEAKEIIKEDACMKFYDVKKNIIHRNRCVWDWFGSIPTANQRQHDLAQR